MGDEKVREGNIESESHRRIPEDFPKRRSVRRRKAEPSPEASEVHGELRGEHRDAGHGGIRLPPGEALVERKKEVFRKRPKPKLVINASQLKKMRGF